MSRPNSWSGLQQRLAQFQPKQILNLDAKAAKEHADTLGKKYIWHLYQKTRLWQVGELRLILSILELLSGRAHRAQQLERLGNNVLKPRHSLIFLA